MMQTAPGTLTIGAATIHDAHRRRRADGRAGDPEVVATSARPRSRCRCRAETHVADASRVGLRHAAADRISRRGRRAAAPGEDLAADRAGDDGVRPRHLGQPGAARARLHDLCHATASCKPVTLLKGDGPVAGRPVITPQTARAVRTMLEMVVQPGGTAPQAQVAGYRVAGKTGTAHKLEGGRLRRQVRVFVRRLRAGVESAPDRRGDDRRAGGRPVLRRRRRGAGVRRGDGCGAAAARRAARRAGWTT